tara:strand:- start:10106 stop:10429 length:324 start_codon:yes stop_codon:yes gene_type:complete
MNRLTNKQMNLYNTQDIEPIFCYYDEVKGVYNFGLVRLGITCVHMTTTLRKLLGKGGVVIMEEEVPLNMKTTLVTKGNKIEILKGVNPNVEDLRESFNSQFKSEEDV